MRRYRTVDQVGRQSIWNVEIGISPDDELRRQHQICDQMIISNDQPEVIRLDSQDFFIFKVTNIKYPIENYQIQCQDNNIIISTKNKTFYKELQISDMQWQKLKLQNKELIIVYVKPVIIKELERAAMIKRKEEC